MVTTLMIFGMSLFSISPLESVLPFTFAISDVVVALMLAYSLFRVKLIQKDPISKATILMATILLISGFYNFLSWPQFDIGNFLYNYLRIIGIVGIILLLPPMLRRIGPDRLARGTIYALRVQCILLLADSYHLLPIEWLAGEFGRSTRPAGLFVESGWFGTWVGLSVIYLAQVQRNAKQPFVSLPDIALWCISVVASTGVRGIILLGFGLFSLLSPLATSRQTSKLLKSLILIPTCLLIAMKVLPQIEMHDLVSSSGLQMVQNRFSGMMPGNFVDASVWDRLISSSVAVSYTLKESPLLGIGLGGVNTKTRLPYYLSTRPDASGGCLMPAGFFVAGGFLGLFVFIFILIKLIVIPETRWFGVGFGLLSLIWGGALESFIWWFIALAIALKGTEQISRVKEAVPLTENAR